MNNQQATQKEWELINKTIARLRASVMAVVFGLVGGLGLFLATAWLLIQGGPGVGYHLSLLDNYFPGYTVTWPGCLEMKCQSISQKKRSHITQHLT